MKNNPLVTVYMPTYNRIALLRRAVDSILRQNYENIELIIVDDGSVDGTVDYLESLEELDSRVRYFVNATNSGACVSRNKAIFAARGEFITGLDDDDYFLPNRISSFLSQWGVRADNAIALFTDSYLVDQYTESVFRTLKYRPQWLSNGFKDLADVRQWVERFVRWYNYEHKHSKIRFVTLQQRHLGQDQQILGNRKSVMKKARNKTPSRWSGRAIRKTAPLSVL